MNWALKNFNHSKVDIPVYKKAFNDSKLRGCYLGTQGHRNNIKRGTTLDDRYSTILPFGLSIMEIFFRKKTDTGG